MLHTVWSLVRRRVTRRLTRRKTMSNAIKYRKTWWNNNKISIYRNRNGTGFFVNLITTSTVWCTAFQTRKLYFNNLSRSTNVDSIDIYLTWLDITWSWFYFSTAAVCPSSWGRQQAANTSNTWSPGSSVLWIDATSAASIHVSLHTIWPCLSWSPSRF